MRVLVLIALVQTYAYNVPSKPRSVNLALETIVEFDNNNNEADLKILDKVRSFLDRVKYVIDQNKDYRRSLHSGKLKFTDFLKHALGILSSYEDSDLENVLSVVDDEIRKYHYKGCKFHELVENNNVRRFMANNLEKVKNAPVKEVKGQMKKMLKTFENNNFNPIQKVVVDYVNSLYGDKSEDKFRNVLENLASYRSRTKRSNLNLVKVVRDGIRSVIFDHYSGLDYETRRDLKLKFETFWQDFSHPEKNLHHLWNFQPATKNYKNIEKSNKHFRDEDDVGSTSLEIHPSTKKAKRSKHDRKHDKAKRHRDKHSTSTKRLTFLTLYPEEMTLLEKPKHKKKSTKSVKPSTFLRNEKLKSKSKNKNKYKAYKEIISEHEVVINVERKSVDRASPAYEDLLEFKSRLTQTTPKRSRMMPRTSNVVSSIKKSPLNKEHEKTLRSRHEKVTLESEEGLSISFEDSDFVKKPFRKSNLNDTLSVNSSSINQMTVNQTSSFTPDGNVIKRINDLEKELRVVQAQMKITKDDSRFNYDHIDFWEGTPKEANPTEPESTTKTTTTSTTTTTPVPETTTTTIATTTKLITTVVSSTNGPVFRAQNTSDSDYGVRKVSIKNEKKSSENNIAEKNEDTKRNVTEVKLMSLDNLDDQLKLKHSDELDYYNDIREPKINITGIEDIERYLNESKPIGDEKTHHIVRKKMLEQLKGVFSENPEEIPKNTEFYQSTPSVLAINRDVTTDSLGFLDVQDDI